MNRSFITAMFLIPFAACVTSEDELATEQTPPEEVAAGDEEARPSTQGLFGGDACTGTEIFITNSRTRNGINTAIDVHYVKFYSDSENDWIQEDLANRMLNFGEQELWENQNLARAENDTITKWRVYYRFLDGGSWSNVVYQEIDTPNAVCDAGDNFYMTVQ